MTSSSMASSSSSSSTASTGKGSSATSSSSSSSSSSWPVMKPPSSSSSSSSSVPSTPLIQRNQNGETLSVIGNMNYVTRNTKLISTRRDVSGSDGGLVGAEWCPTDVVVQNARMINIMEEKEEEEKKKKMTLDANGFELQKSVAPSDLDYLDIHDVVCRYYPLCETLVHNALMMMTTKNGGTKKKTKMHNLTVKAFDHNVRSSSSSSLHNQKLKNSKQQQQQQQQDEDDEKSETNGSTVLATVQNPAGLVHADYTRVSAPRRLIGLSQPPKINDVLKSQIEASSSSSLLNPDVVQSAIQDNETNNEKVEEKTTKKKKRTTFKYAFVNVWRNIDKNTPVQQYPLACIDASSVSFDELRTFQIHYQDRVGENYFVCPPSPSSTTTSTPNNADKKQHQQHSWYYFPNMTYDEVLLLKQWDVRGGLAQGLDRDDRTSSFTVHSAFMDPSSPEDAPPRESIEVRCVAIWEEEEEEEENEA